MLLQNVIYWPLVGMNGTVSTLVAQAYGAGDLKICGVYLNRGRIVNTTIFIPLVVLILLSRKLLAGLGTDAKTLEYAFEYIVICLPGIYFQAMFDLKKRFLNCMKISWVPMLT